MGKWLKNWQHWQRNEEWNIIGKGIDWNKWTQE